jgi:hypothetical protein
MLMATHAAAGGRAPRRSRRLSQTAALGAGLPLAMKLRMRRRPAQEALDD